MARIINLRQRRKQAVRDQHRKQADQNSAKHGQSRADKALADARAALEEKHIDGHKRDDRT